MYINCFKTCSRTEENCDFFGTLDLNGCTYKAKCEVMKMSDALVVIKWQKVNGHYTSYGSTVIGATVVSTSKFQRLPD